MCVCIQTKRVCFVRNTHLVRTKTALRYYFNIRDAKGVISDDEGSELSGITAALQEADASARDFAIDDLRGGTRVKDRSIEITDADGTLLECVAVRRIVLTQA